MVGRLGLVANPMRRRPLHIGDAARQLELHTAYTDYKAVTRLVMI